MPLNKSQLLVLNQENFPDNTQQLITPELLREFNDSMIASMQLTQSMDEYANLGTSNLFYGGNQSIAKEYKLVANGVYWNDSTVGYNNLEIINSATGNLDLAALNGGVRIVSSSLNITNGTFTASLQEGFTYVGNGSNRTTLVSTSSFGTPIPAGTISSSAQITSLGFVSSSVTASSLITASFSGNTLTFTKGNGTTFGVVIPDVSGSTINTGSFATTGSNNFVGDQTITGSIVINESGSAFGDALLIKSGKLRVDAIGNYGDNLNINGGGGGTGDLNLSNTYGGNSIKLQLSGINSIIGNTELTGALNITGSLTASLQQGYVWVGDSTGKTVTVATSSFGGGGTIPAGTISGSQQITDLGFVSSSVTASSIVTASVNNDDITFTKGDGSQFTIQVATGSFALSASYAETASFALNGGVTQILAGPNIIVSPLSGQGQVTISSTGTGSGGFNTATGSYGSFYDTTTQTNPVANAANSMSFNETAITNGVSISGSTNPFNTYIKTENAGVYNLQFSAQLDKTDSGTDSVDIWIRKNGIDLLDTGTTVTLTGNNDKSVAAWNWFVQSAANDYYQIIWASADTDMRLLAEASSSVHPGIPSVIATANRVDQFLSNTGSFSGSFTGTFNGYNLTEFTTTSSFNSYTSSNDSKWSNLAGQTGSYVTSAITASSLVTASFSGNTLTFTKGDSSTFGVVIPDISGSTIDTGSFATTGSNTFIGDETFSNASGNATTLTSFSGSLVFTPKAGFASSSSLQNHLFISASATGQTSITNIIFNTLAQGSPTGSIIISGSNNIITIPTTNTAGFQRRIGSGNIGLAAAPQFTSSMSNVPINYNNNVHTQGNLTFRGPVSSSACNIQGNVLLANTNFGDATESMVSASAGLGFNNNVVLNGPTFRAGRTQLVAFINLNNNLFGHAGFTTTLASSSVTMNNNSFFGASGAFINAYYAPSASATNQRVEFNNNLVGGQSMQFYASGSNTTTTFNRQINNSFFGGNFCIVSASADGNNSSILGTIVYGNNLYVNGNSPYSAGVGSAGYGSTFIGRFNANNGTKALTAETIFAVGTGTGGGVRKTGFLIDSGSNTFIEGTLNVSGATSINGAVNITGSLTSSLTQGFVLVGGTGNVSTLVATSSFVTSIPAGTVSSSAQIVQYNKFATTGSNTFRDYQIFRADLALQDAAGEVDNAIRLQTLDQHTLYIQNTAISSGYNSGSILQLSTQTGSNGYGGSGSAAFQMDALYEGNRAAMKVGTAVGFGSYVQGFADRIEFAKEGGSPNTPATTFRVEANSIELSGSTYISGAVNITGSLLINGIAPLTVDTGSFVTTSSFNSYTSSQDTKNATLGALTGSFATTGSNNFVGNQSINGDLTITNNKVLTTPYATITALSVDGGMGFSQVGNPSDTGMGIQSANKTSLYCSVVSIDSSYNSGSSFVLSATTGSNAYGFSGSADFNMTAQWAGKLARMQVNSSVGTETLVQGSAERISFLGAAGSPNTPSNTFKVEALSIELSGSLKLPVGGDKPAGVVSISTNASGEATFNNVLIQSDSIILLTAKGDYRLWVAAQTSGSATIDSSVASTTITFNYLIINPIT